MALDLIEAESVYIRDHIFPFLERWMPGFVLARRISQRFLAAECGESPNSFCDAFECAPAAKVIGCNVGLLFLGIAPKRMTNKMTPFLLKCSG